MISLRQDDDVWYLRWTNPDPDASEGERAVNLISPLGTETNASITAFAEAVGKITKGNFLGRLG